MEKKQIKKTFGRCSTGVGTKERKLGASSIVVSYPHESQRCEIKEHSVAAQGWKLAVSHEESLVS